MRRFALLPFGVAIVLLFAIALTPVLSAPASAWNLGITYQETCEGYGITVNPSVHQSRNYRYVPYETQVNIGGGWNAVPYSDYSGSLNPWNPSGQHNYQIKIRYQVYKKVGGDWVLQSKIHTEGPIHHRVEKPDDCYEVCSETVETGPEVTYGAWSSWTLNPETGMEERNRTVTYTYTSVDAQDKETVCGTREVEETETEYRWPRKSFNLTSMCRLADGRGQLRVRNDSPIPQEFRLYRVQDGYEITGTAPVGDTLYPVPYGASNDTWKLEIAGWTFTKAIGHNDYCEAQYLITENDCEGWEVTEFTSPDNQGTVVDQGEWTNPYITEYAESYGFKIVEPRSCKQVHEGLVGLDNSCEGWEVFYILDGKRVVVASGVWTKPYKLEADKFAAFDVPVGDGEEIEISDPQNLRRGGTVSEPADCFECEVTPKYRMITLIDNDAEDWYLGHGDRNGTCYVIMHDDAQGVATWRQAEICSVCQHPDFVYEADRVLYDAWVVMDCFGNLSYPDPNWDTQWYNNDPDNICHEESCLNPDVKPAIPDDIVME